MFFIFSDGLWYNDSDIYGGFVGKRVHKTMVASSGKAAYQLLLGFCLGVCALIVMLNSAHATSNGEFNLPASAIWTTDPATVPSIDNSPCCVCETIPPRVNSYTTSRIMTHHTNWIAFSSRSVLWPIILDDLQDMTDQLVANAPAVMQSFSQINDAWQQQRSERALQKLKTESLIRNRPNAKLCTVASTAQTFMPAQDHAKVSAQQAASYLSSRQTSKLNHPAAGGIDQDKKHRWNLYLTKFCDPNDENGAMEKVCKNTNPETMDKDVNYSAVIGAPMTIRDEDKEAVLMLGSYLYGHDLPYFLYNGSDLDPDKNPEALRGYENMQLAVRARSVALNSFISTLALKGEGPPETPEATQRLRSMMLNAGYDSAYVEKTLQDSPSYWARLNILQDSLFTSPENAIENITTTEHVAQNAAAMEAIKTMHLKNIADSLQRQEQLTAVWHEMIIKQREMAVQRSMGATPIEGGSSTQ